MIYLSQLDPVRSRLKLGRSWLTMGRWGCATCSLSMLSERFGSYRSPEELASIPKHFNRRGEIIWENVEFQNFRFVKRIRRKNMQEIDKWIQAGRGVIVQVNWTHFVLLLEKRGNDYIAADPLGGKEINLLQTYPYITGSVHFEQK